ncbi:MAG: glycosyltransferase [Balneola sp.]
MTSLPKKALLISPYFLPRRRVGSLRTYKFAKYLSGFNWRAEVISFETKGSDFTKFEKDALEDIKTHYLKVPYDRTQKHSKSDISKKKTSKKKGVLSVIPDLIDKMIPVDTWYPLLRYHYQEIKEIIRQSKPNVIWTTADPWSNLILGKKLKKKFNLPWVADFRDPWSLCPVRYKKKFSFLQGIESSIELKVIRSADKIVFTSQKTLEMYTSKYHNFAEKFELIHNAFDLGKEKVKEYPELLIESKDKVSLLFFGNFRSSSPASVIIEVLGKVIKIKPDFAKKIQVLHLGTLSDSDLKLAEELGLNRVFKSMNPVSYEEATEVLKKADILLSILNPKRNMVIPSKFWDYLPSETPIFSIGRNEEMQRILTDTGTGVQFSPNEIEDAVNQLGLMIEEIINGQKVSKFDPDFEMIDQYNAKSATKKLATIFDNLLIDNK